MRRLAASAGLLLALSGCGLPSDLSVEALAADRIVRECSAFGLVRRPVGFGLDFVPVPGIKTTAELVAIGIDQVCADPARFARYEGTLAWLIENARK